MAFSLSDGWASDKEKAICFTYLVSSDKKIGFFLSDDVDSRHIKFTSTIMWYPSSLPPSMDLESKAVLKKLPAARSALAELKGVSKTIPNEGILLNTLPLQEAKDSSAVENIITTHDELFKAALQAEELQSQAAKEVSNYAAALRLGFKLVQEYEFLSINHIIQIQAELEQNNAGFRRLPGTTLKNNRGEIVYTPPQDSAEILQLMRNLESYFKDDTLSDVDPLIKMAVIHFQFESIHPFYDGNGRTGRILNILYLVLKGLLDIPVLYLSRYLIQNKAEYYHHLQQVRNADGWEAWLLYMLNGVEETARDTIMLISEMRQLMQHTKQELRKYRFYSQDLLNNLFRHPYTRIEFVQRELKVSRITAASYLNQLVADGVLQKQKLGVSNYYINQPLFSLLARSEG